MHSSSLRQRGGKRTCPRFETASVGFELGTSGFRDPRSYPLGHRAPHKIQILCRRHPFWSYPAVLTKAESIHTIITESIHTTPNSIQGLFNGLEQTFTPHY